MSNNESNERRLKERKGRPIFILVLDYVPIGGNLIQRDYYSYEEACGDAIMLWARLTDICKCMGCYIYVTCMYNGKYCDVWRNGAWLVGKHPGVLKTTQFSKHIEYFRLNFSNGFEDSFEDDYDEMEAM